MNPTIEKRIAALESGETAAFYAKTELTGEERDQRIAGMLELERLCVERGVTVTAEQAKHPRKLTVEQRAVAVYQLMQTAKARQAAADLA